MSAARAGVAAAVVIGACLALASGVSAGLAGERFVLAWPPSFYDSAELALWREAGGDGPLAVRVRARGLDETLEIPTTGVVRLPLPLEARCAEGVDACAIEIGRVEGEAAFRVALQSPSTDGVPDTLAFTAHDTLTAPPAARAGREHVIVSWPAPSASEFPQGASFALVAPAGESPATVAIAGACAGEQERTLAAGEAWTVRCEGEGADLTGAGVIASSPVIVLSGNVAGVVPAVAGAGLSADYLLDASTPREAIPDRTTWIVPPLPRAPAWAGRGDVVRIVALAPSLVRLRDDAGGDETRALAAGEAWDIDTASAEAPDAPDRTLRIDGDGPLLVWHVAKSRAHRGSGDAAAIALAPLEHAVRAPARVFVPDGYGEGTSLHLACEAGAAPTVAGAPVATVPAPGGGATHASVDLGAVAAGGSVVTVDAAGCVGWTFGRGGYKAHGALALAEPSPIGVAVRRGARPDELEVIGRTTEGAFRDDEPASLAFYDVVVAVRLDVRRCDEGTCLSWDAVGVP